MIKSKLTLIEILKEKYLYENERKRYYDNVITIPVSLLGFIVAGVYVIINEKTNVIWFQNLKPWFIYPLIVSTIISMILLFMVFFGLRRKYSSFPDTKIVMKDYNKLVDYYKEVTVDYEDEKLDEDLNDFIIKWYNDINNNNIKVNDLRMNIFHINKIFIGLSYLLGILVFSFYFYTKVNLSTMSTENNSTPQQQPPAPPAKPADVPPPAIKPSPSPVRFEKGQKGGNLK